jgi:hypothetical protein
MRLPVAYPVDNAFDNLPRGTEERHRSDMRPDVTRQHPSDMIEGCRVANVFKQLRTSSCFLR